MMYFAADDNAGGSNRKPIILLIVLLVALAGSLGYQRWKGSDDDVVVKPRRATSFLVTWQCDNCQHTEDAPGGMGPKPCPKCGKDTMYATTVFICPTHGAVGVGMQYDENGRLVQVRPGKVWLPLAGDDGRSNVKCPECGAEMGPGEAPRPVKADQPGK